jgi:outer membrane immunogenic protein
MRNIALAATAAALLLTGSAQAAGLNGFYAGISAGEEFAKEQGVGTNFAGLFPNAYDYKVDGGTIGALAGFNMISSNLLFGVEADIDWSGIDGEGSFAGGRVHHVNVNYEASVRGRIGLLTGANVVYLAGGYAMANADNDIRFAGFSPFHSYTTTKTGWTLGAGVEHSFDDTFSARVEYRYTDYGQDVDAVSAANSRDTNSLKSNAVRGALIMHF